MMEEKKPWTPLTPAAYVTTPLSIKKTFWPVVLSDTRMNLDMLNEISEKYIQLLCLIAQSNQASDSITPFTRLAHLEYNADESQTAETVWMHEDNYCMCRLWKEMNQGFF